MAVNLSYMTQVGANKWVIRPSGDGVTGMTDADNIQYAINLLSNSTSSGTIQLEEGTYYIGHEIDVVSYRGTIRGRGEDATCLIAGTGAGQPIAANPLQYAIDRRRDQLPVMFCLSVSDSSGLTYDVSIELLRIETLRNDSARPGNIYVGMPRDNLNNMCHIMALGRQHVGYRLAHGEGSGLTKINATTMQLECDPGTFRASDLGGSITINGAASLVNNGRFVITSVVSSSVIQYTNAAGLTQADFERVVGINEPETLVVSGGKLRVTNVCFVGQLSDERIAQTHAAIAVNNPGLCLALPSADDGWSDPDLWGMCKIGATEQTFFGSSQNAVPVVVDLDVSKCTFIKTGVSTYSGFAMKPRSTPIVPSGEDPLPMVWHAAGLSGKLSIRDCRSSEPLHAPYFGCFNNVFFNCEEFSLKNSESVQTLALRAGPPFSAFWVSFGNLIANGSQARMWAGIIRKFHEPQQYYDASKTREVAGCIAVSESPALSTGASFAFGVLPLELRGNSITGSFDWTFVGVDGAGHQIISNRMSGAAVFYVFLYADGTPFWYGSEDCVVKNNVFEGIAYAVEILDLGVNNQLKNNDYVGASTKKIMLGTSCSGCAVSGDGLLPAVVDLGAGNAKVATGAVSTNPADAPSHPPHPNKEKAWKNV
jgi:hypothetical protein